MKRLDVALVEAGLAPSRARAQAMITDGKVAVRGRICRRAAEPVSDPSEISLTEPDHPYVSRGGLKLAAALDRFGVDPRGLHVLDVGISTGGFTHCLLLRGAARVVGVDVGHGQLAPVLRCDERVQLIEGMNVRELTPCFDPVDLAVVDVSFISLTKVLPRLPRFLRPGAALVALVKPQFEVGRGGLDSRGVVRRTELYPEVLANVRRAAEAAGFTVTGEMESPVEGGDGNREFLLHAVFSGHALV